MIEKILFFLYLLIHKHQGCNSICNKKYVGWRFFLFSCRIKQKQKKKKNSKIYEI